MSSFAIESQVIVNARPTTMIVEEQMRTLICLFRYSKGAFCHEIRNKEDSVDNHGNLTISDKNEVIVSQSNIKSTSLVNIPNFEGDRC